MDRDGEGAIDGVARRVSAVAVDRGHASRELTPAGRTASDARARAVVARGGCVSHYRAALACVIAHDDVAWAMGCRWFGVVHRYVEAASRRIIRCIRCDAVHRGRALRE